MKEVHILLVDDSDGDVLLTMELFSEARIKNRLSVVRDGMEAIRFLKKEAEYFHVDLPDLVLLDINLPKIDGKEVLHFIKKDPTLKKIPVIILTTSSCEKDMSDAFNNHANCFITKPVYPDDFLGILRTIEDFYISIVQLPNTIV